MIIQGEHREIVDDETIGVRYLSIAEACEMAYEYDPMEYPYSMPEEQDRLRRRVQNSIQGVKRDPQGNYRLRASSFRGWLIREREERNNMAWKRFDERIAIPQAAEDYVVLAVRTSGATFTFRNWQAVADATHAIYYVDEPNKRIGIRFIKELEAEAGELAVAYKITRNGYKQFSVTCSKLLLHLPFDLVNTVPQPRGKLQAGKWTLPMAVEADGMIAISQDSSPQS